MEFIESREALRAHYRPVHENAAKKVLPKLDPHARNFLSRSPFLMMGTQDAAGRADVSPKGDKPGFVAPLDDVTLAIPDRPGNNRLDSWENLVDNPSIGLIFVIPGMAETLRINGEAKLTVDEELCARLGVDGRPAQAVCVVKIRELYMHCAKAFMRSELWKPETWPDRKELPSLGQIMRDQLALAESSDEIDAGLADSYSKSMW
ncbi:pyridoxamine 5'-phosphate oxidase family protein [Pseudoroseicyclus tamaricis]|uniref:Pyridoxamine 5'-phosphate oxidase family protein n=1 Tax=Pseudoroseicyclus tamaricis TaxID=2705421 RepID=A0A6B2JY13_9RHOB|nr:pyridoxamine 5'-phosphate oxidase family protein [Pseudoroseicyclus tamaricis]NDV00242.1 pyridoxamine 5'-phosphate oxidase family protein [Pseudoroseicyclus tamaricis]